MTEYVRKNKKSTAQHQQKTVLQEETVLDKRIQKVASLLEELAKERKFIDIHICPHCKSARVQLAGGFGGDMVGHWTASNPKFECLNCGWRGRLTMYATNRPISLKGMGVVAEAYAQHQEDMQIAQ